MNAMSNVADWNAGQYLKFAEERTQPSRDLIHRLALDTPRSILDLGCGPGNSTQVLREHFSEAEILGVDSSPDMIAKAGNNYPGLAFSRLSITPSAREITESYDLIFSNACIQWIPEHRTLLANLFRHLNPGGALAIQIPLTAAMPMYRILGAMSQDSPWRAPIDGVRNFHTLSREEYYDLLSELTPRFSLWQTEYLHVMAGYSEMIEWYCGSGLRPYLAALPQPEHPAFLAEIERRLQDYCALRPNGKLLMPFPRLFMILYRAETRK